MESQLEINKPNIDKNDYLSIIQIMNKDDILVNLKIFSKIKKNDKLSISENLLEIENRYFASIRRWLNNDNRKDSLLYISSIIDKAFTIIDETYSNEQQERNKHENNNNPVIPFKEENSELLKKFSVELTNAINGLINLKYTYTSDSLIQSKIDLLIDKVNIRIKKINNLLKIEI